MNNLSTRARITILVVLVALPTLALTIYSAWDERGRSVAAARLDLHRIASLAAQQQEQIIEGAKQALVAISLIPSAVRNDRAKCNDFLATLLAKSKGIYHSVGIYGADGFLQCNAVPWQGKISSPDRLYFKLALATGQFTIGEYQVGKVTKQQGINLGYPITNARGEVTGVAFIALDLGSLNRMAAAVPLPELGVLAVIDRGGILLARVPPNAGSVGEALPFAHILKAVMAGRSGEFEATGYGGLGSLIAYDTVADNPNGEIAMRVVVSVPLHVVLADANRAILRNVVGILIATVILVIGAWYGAGIFILRRVRVLLGVAKQVEGGNLGARTGLAGGRDELGQLGAAFDNMARALQGRESELQQALDELRQQALTDVLTGLHNRRFLFEVLPRELARARRNKTTVAVIMMDVDHFKRVNDTYGHKQGDLVLKAIADVLESTVRASDTCCRYGGEEFSVVMPEAPIEDARVRAEAIRDAIASLQIECRGHESLKVTISIGIAAYPEHGDDMDALMRAADEALYEAKGAGRNRVIIKSAGDAASN